MADFIPYTSEWYIERLRRREDSSRSRAGRITRFRLAPSWHEMESVLLGEIAVDRSIRDEPDPRIRVIKAQHLRELIRKYLLRNLMR